MAPHKKFPNSDLDICLQYLPSEEQRRVRDKGTDIMSEASEASEEQRSIRGDKGTDMMSEASEVSEETKCLFQEIKDMNMSHRAKK